MKREGQSGELGVGEAGTGPADDVQRAREEPPGWGGGADHTASNTGPAGVRSLP